MKTSKEKSDRIDKRVRWKIVQWEFARLNAKVQEAYEKGKELRMQAECSPNDVKKIGPLLHFPYLDTPQAQRERELCEELGLHFRCLIDPQKSYEDLMNGPDSIEKNCFFPDVYWEPWGKPSLQGSHLIIDIDFSKVNSIDALKKEMADLLQFQYSEFYEKYLKKTFQPEAERKRRERDFDRILEVGKMREQGLKNQEIAEKLFPDDFLPDEKLSLDAKPDSALIKISQYYQEYKTFVDGGYKNITYP